MSRALDASSLLFLTGLTALLGLERARLSIDTHNVAMKSDASPEARVEQRKREDFGAKDTLLLVLAPAGAGELPPAEQELDDWVRILEASPGVESARLLPARLSGPWPALALQLAGDAGAGGAAASRAAPESIRAALASAESNLPAGARLLATGGALGEASLSAALEHEGRRILPAVLGVLALGLLVVYRRVRLVLGVLLPPLVAVVWTGGIQKLAGIPIDPLSGLLPPLLLTVGVAGGVHLLEHHLAARRSGASAAAASRGARRWIARPASLAALTTIFGLAGLSLNEIPAVRRFAWLAALGVLLAFGLTMLALPAWLRLTDGADATPSARARGCRPAERLIAWIRRRRRAILTVGAAATLAAGTQWAQIRVDTEPLHVLPPAHAFRATTEEVGERLGGIETFDLYLEPPAPSPLGMKLASLVARLSAIEQVRGLAGPPERSERGSFVVPVLLAPGGTARRERAFDAAEELARELGWESAHATGSAVLVARDSQRLVHGQLRGLALSASLVGLTLVFGLRSLALGLLAMIPNLMPCVLLYGGMAALGRPLTVGTSMIGAVFLGLVVDDTVHALSAYARERRLGRGRPSGWIRAFRHTGRALVTTSGVLAAGFLVCVAGDLASTREFGVLAALIVTAALLANLAVLPAIFLPPSKA